MNNFEKIKNMTLDEMAEFLSNKFNVCELDKSCCQCSNESWCNCSTVSDFKGWLNGIN